MIANRAVKSAEAKSRGRHPFGSAKSQIGLILPNIDFFHSLPRTTKWSVAVGTGAMEKRKGGGYTLLEALVGMALLGTLLSATLMSYGRYVHQTQRAAERMNIMREAEALLIRWQLQSGYVPVDEEGELLVGVNTYRWRTRPAVRVLDESLMIGSVHFEVTGLQDDAPLLNLELIVPSWGEL